MKVRMMRSAGKLSFLARHRRGTPGALLDAVSSVDPLPSDRDGSAAQCPAARR
jgi:hypothetical protein